VRGGWIINLAFFVSIGGRKHAPHWIGDRSYFSGIADKIARSALLTSSEFLKTLATSGSKVTVIFISFT